MSVRKYVAEFGENIFEKQSFSLTDFIKIVENIQKKVKMYLIQKVSKYTLHLKISLKKLRISAVTKYTL